MAGGDVPRIAIVGAGLSGTAFALHLMRDHPNFAAEISLIDPGSLGAGLAYSTTDPAHRTNVAASRMSLFKDDPDHFDRSYRAAVALEDDPNAAWDTQLYPSRASFGRYAASELSKHATAARAVAFTHIKDRAGHAERHGPAFTIHLDSGAILTADIVVLATGHPPARLPRYDSATRTAQSRVIEDPWQRHRLDAIQPSDSVLIVGTGLTMFDMVATLDRRGHHGPVVAVSRRGLLPRTRSLTASDPWGDFTMAPAQSAIALLQRVRAAIAEAALRGRSWEDVVAALRVQARTVWGALSTAERRRLLRHLRPFWDVHRYQPAPQVADIVARQRATGRLTIRRGNLLAASDAGHQVIARIGTARTGAVEHRAEWLINCTGAGQGGALANPLIASLAAKGLLRGDPCGLGLDVDRFACAIDQQAQSQPNIIVVGPLARSQYGELMGLPQISDQPREAAAYFVERQTQ